MVARPDGRRGGGAEILMTQSASVYIIQSQTLKTFYTGVSTDVLKRITEHNSGKTKSTRNKGPWILRFAQRYDSLQQARHIETKLKKLKRRDYLEQIIADEAIKIC